MRLAGARFTSDPGDRLASAANTLLDSHLLTDSARPLAVAFSGGGDSLALLLVACDWAQAAGRRLIVLTVDHDLQALSRGWTQTCAATAQRLGVEFRPLTWEGAKPMGGLPAAARVARHRLLADAARAAGARVILMGHTADDRLESHAMRAAGSTTPDVRAWGPSPAWPEGRGVFLLRPLLGVRRAAIREWLGARGEAWIDDPANEDLRFARPRARAGLTASDVDLPSLEPLDLARHTDVDPVGGLSLSRGRLLAASRDDALRWLSVACVCAGGGDRRPASARLQRVLDALGDEVGLTATLAGARIEADADLIHIRREAGEAGRGGLSPVRLVPGEARVWDGRFELETAVEGLEVRRLAGMSRRLPPAQRRALAGLPASARLGLPAMVTSSGDMSSPLLGSSDVTARLLVHERLLAAARLVAREPA